MRIVHVTNYFMPELGYQEYYLAYHQAAAGHDVHVVTSNRRYPAQSDYAVFATLYPERIADAGKTVVDGFTLHRLEAVAESNMQLLLRGLIRLIAELKPDLVVMHGFTRYETLRIAAYKWLLRPRFKLVIDDHTLFSAYDPRIYRRVYHAAVRAVFRALRSAVDQIVAVTGETSEFLGQQFGVRDSEIIVLPIGADVELFEFDPAARARIRKRLEIDGEDIVLLYAGKITPEKGAHLVLRLAREALERSPRMRVIFVGSGADTEYAASIRRTASEWNLENRVVVHRHVSHDDLREFFCAADIAMWPMQETMAALEAAACGLPIVLPASQVGLERTSAQNGFACASDAEFEEALVRLAADGDLRRRMGERGAALVRDRFNWRRIADDFILADEVA
jgi:glycosyltransferase involved in cell wall biosynthesis